MALGGSSSNKTLTILTRFDADASGYFREVEKVNAKTKEAQSASAGLSKVLGEIKLERVKQAFSALGVELGGTAKAMAETAAHGFEVGAMFGPWGAAIGGVAGALVGLVKNLDQQSLASKRAEAAARKHAEALQLVAEGETKARLARRGSREAVELAEEELNQARLNATAKGLSQDSVDVERARRQLRDAQDELRALNRTDGVIWLEQRKRETERLDMIKDNEAAVRTGLLTEAEAKRRLDALNKSQSESLNIVEQYRKKQQDAAEAVALLNRSLQAGRIDAKAYEELLRSVDDDYRARDDERKKREEDAIKRARALAEERRKLVNAEAIRVTDDLVKRLEGEVDTRVSGPLGSPTNDTAGIDTGEMYRQQVLASDRALIAHQEMADAIQREIDLQREYASIVGQAYGEIVSGSSSALGALKGIAKQQLVALGVREAVEAASQFAYGLGALANPLFAGAAAMHFASAAKHAGAAALAGVGVAAVGAIGGGSSGGGSSSAGSSGFGGSSGGSSSSSPPQTITNYYIVGDSFAENSPRMQQRNFERVVEIGMQRTSVGRAE